MNTIHINDRDGTFNHLCGKLENNQLYIVTCPNGKTHLRLLNGLSYTCLKFAFPGNDGNLYDDIVIYPGNPGYSVQQVKDQWITNLIHGSSRLQ